MFNANADKHVPTGFYVLRSSILSRVTPLMHIQCEFNTGYSLALSTRTLMSFSDAGAQRR